MVLEYVVCVALVWVVATCLLELCVAFILLQEGYRRLRSFADRSMNSFHAASAETFDTAPGTSCLGRQLFRSLRVPEMRARAEKWQNSNRTQAVIATRHRLFLWGPVPPSQR